MFANTQRPDPKPQSTYRQELALLYARRSAIDALIDSLETYARIGNANGDEGERQRA